MTETIKSWADQVVESVEKVIYGKRHVIEQLLVAILCRGHVLLEDVPGVGKTILARAISTTLGGDFARIQCTPDLLPADVLGVSIYNQQTSEFDFKPGPVVTNVLLVDEINRATPRTQSALLEAMEERRISVEGRTIDLPKPFFIIATENPVEFEGTFPLPAAQEDRFFLSLSMGYPPKAAELEIMYQHRRLTHPVSDLEAVTSVESVIEMQRMVLEVGVQPELEDYILRITEATRNDSRLQIGASPRASIALYHGAKAVAALRGRDSVDIDDIYTIAVPVLQKRIGVRSDQLLKGVTPGRIIEEILDRVPSPEPAA
jgi:MoxR-like ATPase